MGEHLTEAPLDVGALIAATEDVSSGAVALFAGIVHCCPLLLRWANFTQSAAVSAALIVANSTSGLASYAFEGHAPSLASGPFLVAAIVGVVIGARVGAKQFSSRAFASTLGLGLVLAAVKLLLAAAA